MAGDASYNTQNYATQGGTAWVIGATGTLDFKTGAKLLTNGAQATQVASIVNNTSGSGLSGGTLTAAVEASGTMTTGGVAAINNNFTVVAAQIAALNTVLRGIGATA